jgi:hypothetical protein
MAKISPTHLVRDVHKNGEEEKEKTEIEGE